MEAAPLQSLTLPPRSLFVVATRSIQNSKLAQDRTVTRLPAPEALVTPCHGASLPEHNQVPKAANLGVFKPNANKLEFDPAMPLDDDRICGAVQGRLLTQAGKTFHT